jgi:hypothetical protein
MFCDEKDFCWLRDFVGLKKLCHWSFNMSDFISFIHFNNFSYHYHYFLINNILISLFFIFILFLNDAMIMKSSSEICNI